MEIVSIGLAVSALDAWWQSLGGVGLASQSKRRS
jgi:hypothetical protein